jgi:hypothetical protein
MVLESFPRLAVFHMARKHQESGNSFLRAAEAKLRERLPNDWLIRRRATPSDDPFDARLTIGPSAQESATILVEAKTRVGPRDVQPFADRWRRSKADEPWMLVAPYLSPRTRELLEAAGANYIDDTGNVLVTLRKPAVFIRTIGADSDPSPVESKLRSLKGPAASRVVRAILDFKPPYGISGLAERAGSPLSTVHRVVDLIDTEGLLEREPRGPITSVDWQGLLQRWTSEYGLSDSNRVETYIEPRGLDRLLERLRSSQLDYAVTGSLAAARLAPIAATRLGMVFVDGDADDAAETLGLTPTDVGANVFLIEPFDRVAFERGELDDGIRYAAPSQVAADLAKSPGRGPSESVALIKWMAANEDAWRS